MCLFNNTFVVIVQIFVQIYTLRSNNNLLLNKRLHPRIGYNFARTFTTVVDIKIDVYWMHYF